MAVRGQIVKVYFDGQLVFDKTDPRFPPRGGIALSTYESIAHFRGLEVWKAEPGIQDALVWESEFDRKKAALSEDERREIISMATTAFRDDIARVRAIMEGLDDILATRPDYRLWYAYQNMETPEQLRGAKEMFFALFGYFRYEGYEPLHLIYRPEVEAFIDEYEKRMKERDPELMPMGDPYDLKDEEIRARWLDEPLPVPPQEYGSTLDAIRRAGALPLHRRHSTVFSRTGSPRRYGGGWRTDRLHLMSRLSRRLHSAGGN